MSTGHTTDRTEVHKTRQGVSDEGKVNILLEEKKKGMCDKAYPWAKESSGIWSVWTVFDSVAPVGQELRLLRLEISDM